jgi:NAD(P)H-nitrite reductase large subunit
VIKELRAALKIVQEQEKRKKAYDKLVGAELSYPIIKDLINSAAHGVVIEATLKDGSKLVIRRQENFEEMERIRREAW